VGDTSYANYLRFTFMESAPAGICRDNTYFPLPLPLEIGQAKIKARRSAGVRLEGEVMSQDPRPVWFGPEDAPMFGLVYARTDSVRGAVVLCGPLGREHTSSYTTFARLASRLAESGLLVLRFDYRSTGDSFNRPEVNEPSPGLLDDVHHAIDYVRRLGAGHVSLVGMRMGGLLAALAASVEPVGSVVMWDPCTTGRAFVRQQRVLGLGVPAAGGPSEDAAGLYIAPEILQELATIELGQGTAGLADRVLILAREGRPLDRKLADPLLVPKAEHQTVAGQEELLEAATPFQVVPVDAVESIVGWIDGATPSGSHPVRLPEPAEVVVPAWSAASPDGTEGASVPAVVEKAVRLGPANLFGIQSEPKGGASGPTFILVSVANEHRIGPGRLWVELGRRLAALGFQCVRLDLGGVGDSPGGPVGHDQVYAFSAIEDVVAAARALSPDDPTNVVLTGLCSSGYHVLEAAQMLSPRGLLGINPTVLFPPPETLGGGPPHPGRRFNVRESTATSIRAKVVSIRWLEDKIPGLRWAGRRFPDATLKARRVGRRAIDQLGRPFRAIAWRRASRPGGTRSGPATHLADLARTGTDVFLVCGPEEMRPFASAPELLGTAAASQRRLSLDVMPELDHALRRPVDRAEVTKALLGHVEEHFQAGLPAPIG
jgi:pimeloyl-ACP methyl ester carboxylesterase